MPETLTYPGVYIEEPPSGVRTIVGVATSIAAFVGRAQRGPPDKAIVINSYADFERRFGGLWIDSSLGYAVRDFYLNGGSQAVIVRLFSGPQTLARAQAQAAAESLVAEANIAATVATPPATAASVATAVNKKVAAVSAAGPVATSVATAVDTAAKGAATKATTPPPAVKDVVDAVTGAAAKAVSDAVAALPSSKAALTVPTDKGDKPPESLDLEAAYEGAWGNQLRMRIDAIDPKVSKDFPNAFNLTVRDVGSNVTELFRNVTTVDGSRRIDKVLENESRLVRLSVLPKSRGLPTAHRNPNPREDIWKIDDLSAKVLTKVEDGGVLSTADFIGPGKDVGKQGLYALRDADLFNLLCIPPYQADGNIEYASELLADALAFCAERRAMMLVDPPAEWHNKDAAVAGFNAPDSQFTGNSNNKNAAFYFPRLKQPNPLRDGQLEEFAPCGALAGVFARTDTTRGVWKAPAGLDAMLGGVPQLSVPLTDGEIGELNPLGINCLRTMPAAGRVVWGARTLSGADRLSSDWKYIPVRRTALFIEESLYRATQWIVFEPNDEPLWSQIRLNIGAFMHDLFRKGAFQGTTPKDAYFVKCDKETTTQSDINLGIVNIVVGFAPLKPAEFVVIKLQQMAGQIDV